MPRDSMESSWKSRKKRESHTGALAHHYAEAHAPAVSAAYNSNGSEGTSSSRRLQKLVAAAAGGIVEEGVGKGGSPDKDRPSQGSSSRLLRKFVSAAAAGAAAGGRGAVPSAGVTQVGPGSGPAPAGAPAASAAAAAAVPGAGVGAAGEGSVGRSSNCRAPASPALPPKAPQSSSSAQGLQHSVPSLSPPGSYLVRLGSSEVHYQSGTSGKSGSAPQQHAPFDEAKGHLQQLPKARSQGEHRSELAQAGPVDADRRYDTGYAAGAVAAHNPISQGQGLLRAGSCELPHSSSMPRGSPTRGMAAMPGASAARDPQSAAAGGSKAPANKPAKAGVLPSGTVRRLTQFLFGPAAAASSVPEHAQATAAGAGPSTAATAAVMYAKGGIGSFRVVGSAGLGDAESGSQRPNFSASKHRHGWQSLAASVSAALAATSAVAGETGRALDSSADQFEHPWGAAEPERTSAGAGRRSVQRWSGPLAHQPPGPAPLSLQQQQLLLQQQQQQLVLQQQQQQLALQQQPPRPASGNVPQSTQAGAAAHARPGGRSLRRSVTMHTASMMSAMLGMASPVQACTGAASGGAGASTAAAAEARPRSEGTPRALRAPGSLDRGQGSAAARSAIAAEAAHPGGVAGMPATQAAGAPGAQATTAGGPGLGLKPRRARSVRWAASEELAAYEAPARAHAPAPAPAPSTTPSAVTVHGAGGRSGGAAPAGPHSGGVMGSSQVAGAEGAGGVVGSAVPGPAAGSSVEGTGTPEVQLGKGSQHQRPQSPASPNLWHVPSFGPRASPGPQTGTAGSSSSGASGPLSPLVHQHQHSPLSALRGSRAKAAAGPVSAAAGGGVGVPSAAAGPTLVPVLGRAVSFGAYQHHHHQHHHQHPAQAAAVAASPAAAVLLPAGVAAARESQGSDGMAASGEFSAVSSLVPSGWLQRISAGATSPTGEPSAPTAGAAAGHLEQTTGAGLVMEGVEEEGEEDEEVGPQTMA